MSPRPPESQSTALVSCHLGSQCLQPIIQWLACINCQARRAAEMPSPAFLWFALAPASTARCPAALLLGAAAASQALLSCRSLSCPSRPTSLLSWQEQPWSCLGARHSLSLRGSSRSRELPHHLCLSAVPAELGMQLCCADRSFSFHPLPAAASGPPTTASVTGAAWITDLSSSALLQ